MNSFKFTSKKIILIMITIFCFFTDLITCQKPNLYENLVNQRDLPHLMNQYETVFLFYYDSSLLQYRIILENLTKVRSLPFVRKSKVSNIFFMLIVLKSI